jgi:TolB-like protein/HEPN domain-containing protein
VLEEPDLSERVERLEAEVASIRRLYEKTLDYSERDPETALMNARKAAEAVCSRVFEHKVGKPPKSMTLQPLIEKLTQLDAIPEHILVALRTIQSYGNFGSHHQAGEPQSITAAFAQPCLQALGTVVQWYFDEYSEAKSPAGDNKHRIDAARPRIHAPTRLIAGLAGLAALLTVAFVTARSGPTRVTSTPRQTHLDDAAVAPHGSRIAILPFEALSSNDSDTSGYEEGIVRILEKPLKASPHLDVVERADIDKAIGELKLTRDSMFDQSTVSQIGRLVGAQKLLLGSYFKIGKNLRIDARVVDTETGRILSSVAREGQPDELTELVTAIGEEIAGAQKPNLD